MPASAALPALKQDALWNEGNYSAKELSMPFVLWRNRPTRT